jgi:hypothetical protein
MRSPARRPARSAGLAGVTATTSIAAPVRFTNMPARSNESRAGTPAIGSSYIARLP